MIAVAVKGLTKEFKLGQTVSLAHRLKSVCKGFMNGEKETVSRFKALDDVNFEVEQGEVVGIIGSNGAGKSTLFKVMAGITDPTEGTIEVNGGIAPLIEVGAGMHPELTGRENIYLNSSILGVPIAAIKEQVPKIIEFAELEEFIDTPIKRYSSGMRTRLGFSIAIHIDAEILIFDEVLSVGDIAFQRKCFDAIERIIKRSGKTVLIVHHNIRQIQRICDRVIMLDHGKIVADGPADEICAKYYQEMDKKILDKADQKAREVTSGDMKLVNVAVSAGGVPVESVKPGEDLTVEMAIDVVNPMDKPVFALGVHTTDFVYISTKRWKRFLEEDTVLQPGRYVVRCVVSGVTLLPGVYCLRVIVETGPFSKMAYQLENVFSFRVEHGAPEIGNDESEGFFDMPMEWNCSPVDL